MKINAVKKGRWLFLLCFAGNFFVVALHATVKQTSDTLSLKIAVGKFIQSVDSGKIDNVIEFYDDDFKSIRVVDQGPLIKMDGQQMIYFWKTLVSRNQSASTGPNRGQLAVQNTTIHYVEVTGETGYVRMTRIKDLGSGPGTLFYNLVRRFTKNQWRPEREIVHQHTLPKGM